MNGIVKVLTGILGVLAVLACLATVGIVGYSLIDGENSKDSVQTSKEEEPEPTEIAAETETPTDTEASAVPTQVPEETSPKPDQTPAPMGNVLPVFDHVHDYEESLEKRANCYSAGRIKYTCECGETYYVDVMSTGHVAGDWETVRKPTEDNEGLRVRKCIYCDEIMAQENLLFENVNGGSSGSGSNEGAQGPHTHQYTASTEREPSCILAGLRKYTCSCGNFYTEMIPAPGHVATDWTVAAEPTTTMMGTEERTCVVCGVLLDSRPVNMLSPSPGASTTPAPAASAGQSSSSSAPTSAPTPSAAPSATPHSHNYQSYVLKEANCTEKGIRSFVCSCGSSKAESIELDMNNHTFRAVVISATSTTQGYTAYTCIRCNYSYFDNYTPAIGH
ncbi:MAG: hypothetical protein K2H52_12280 [Lachnospiraceae bacterium]|nr:hypothetical protein [Lachnospiraceae bacterium]MDE6185904.1 hypothetical protein [Lachnospiraceae bacterium]